MESAGVRAAQVPVVQGLRINRARGAAPNPHPSLSSHSLHQDPQPDPAIAPSEPASSSAPSAWPRVDLRRRRTRDAAETVLSRAEFLHPVDRALVQAVYGGDAAVAELARISGFDSAELRRRIRRAVVRMFRPEFLFVAMSRAAWPLPMRSAATALFLHGRTLRQAARELGMSVYQVRQYRDVVLARMAERDERIASNERIMHGRPDEESAGGGEG